MTLSLAACALAIDDTVVPLSSGMTVTTEIKTESGRVIDYILSPLAKIASEAMKK